MSGSIQISSIRSHNFTLYYLMSQKNDLLKCLQDSQRKIKNMYLMLLGCMFNKKNSYVVLCLLSSEFYFVRDNVAADF